MTTYLVFKGEKTAIDDLYFTPTEGMYLTIDEIPHKIKEIRTVVRKSGQKADIEQELIVE